MPLLNDGLWELRYPLANPPVLWNLHAGISFLAIAGLAYTLKFFPRRR
jgi:hypothetical protein